LSRAGRSRSLRRWPNLPASNSSNQPRGHPLGAHALRSVPAFTSQCRGPAARTRHRRQPRNHPVLVGRVRTDVYLGNTAPADLEMRAFSRWQWHVDKVFVKINGARHYLWRAVDHEGEVLESVVTKRRNKRAALKMLRKLMRRYGQPEIQITDRFPSYKAALRDLGYGHLQSCGRWPNNRVENSHLPFRRRERAMQRFLRMRSLQKFVAVHSSIFNHFNQDRSFSKRDHFK